MSDPLPIVRDWYEHALTIGVPEPEAMALATADREGAPSVRFVLLKSIDERGVCFFSNYESRKGRELAENARAAVALLWQPLQRQVRIEGVVEKLSTAESDTYFATRARGSQLGAWASPQSQPIESRDALERRVAECERRFADAVPRPPHWGGYRLVADVVELWQGRHDRLHEREQFRRVDGGPWRSRRLAP